MGAKNDFNQLFKDFQADEFFQDALYALSWDEVVVGPINRVSGSSSSTTTTYNAMAFWLIHLSPKDLQLRYLKISKLEI